MTGSQSSTSCCDVDALIDAALDAGRELTVLLEETVLDTCPHCQDRPAYSESRCSTCRLVADGILRWARASGSLNRARIEVPACIEVGGDGGHDA